MKKIFGIILILIMFIIPFKINAACEVTYNRIGPEMENNVVSEATVPSGTVLEYIISTNFADGMKKINTFYKTIKVSLSNKNGVNCTIIPLNDNLYTYSNGTFTVIEENIEIKSSDTGIATYDVDVAKIQCQMPTVEKYKKGYDFNITVDYDKIDRYDSGDKSTKSKKILNNKISLLNENYIKSLDNTPPGLDANITGATLDSTCGTAEVCFGEVNADSVTLNYSLRNQSVPLMYAVGKYYDLFDIRDLKTYKLVNKNGSVGVKLNFGNNYIVISTVDENGNNNTEFGRVVSELKNYPDLRCFEDNLLDDKTSERKEFIINRIDNRSNDSTLKSLTITDAQINFDPNVKNYTVSIPNKTKEVTVSSVVNHSKATYVIGYGNRKVTLKEGNNEILIKVKAENGTESVYTINLVKEASNNYNLVSISVDDKVIKMTKNKYKYSVKVNNNVTRVNISAIAEHPDTLAIVNDNRDLVEGSNIITLTVTAPNGEKKIYELDVIRDSLVSTNADLLDLKIENYDLDFSSNVNKYKLTIKGEKELKISYVVDSNKSNVEVIGNSKLRHGSIIKIKVTAEDNKTVNIYEIKILKDIKKTLLFIGGIVLLIIIIIVLISFSNKQNSNGNNNVNKKVKNKIKNKVNNTNINSSNNDSKIVDNNENNVTNTNNEINNNDGEKPLIELVPEDNSSGTPPTEKKDEQILLGDFFNK